MFRNARARQSASLRFWDGVFSAAPSTDYFDDEPSWRVDFA